MTNEQFSEALSEEPKVFKFTLSSRNWFEKLLFKWKIKEQIKTIEVSPITLGARARYSKYALKLDVFETGKGVSATRAGLLMADKHIDDIVKAIAIVIHNKETTPPSWMVREIYKMDQNDMIEIISFVVKSVNTDSFLNSIISINGMSLQTEEIIAPEKENQGNTK